MVCSAMGDTTDELLDLAAQVSPVPPAREMGYAPDSRRAYLQRAGGDGN